MEMEMAMPTLKRGILHPSYRWSCDWHEKHRYTSHPSLERETCPNWQNSESGKDDGDGDGDGISYMDVSASRTSSEICLVFKKARHDCFMEARMPSMPLEDPTLQVSVQFGDGQ